MSFTRSIGYWLLGVGLVMVISGLWMPDNYALLSAFIGAVLFAVGAAPAFIRTDDVKDKNDNLVTPWYFLLSEPHGGYSLARMQFIIWFLPAFAMYVALCIVRKEMVVPNETFTLLLGLSTATTVVSTAATPKPGADPNAGGGGPTAPGPTPGTPSDQLAETLLKAYHEAATAQAQLAAGNQGGGTNGPEGISAITSLVLAQAPALLAAQVGVAPKTPPDTKVDPPHLRDLVQDFDNHGDVSRYQYLLLCSAIVGMLLVQFFSDQALPNLSRDFWQLVGVSQVAYVGTKIVKTVKAS